MFRIESENHAELKNSLKELIEELKRIKNINIENVSYKIVFRLGGDLKALALLLGLNAANSSHACIWCHCNLKERVNLDKEWPISRSQSIAHIQSLAKKDGYKYDPIFDFLEFDEVVIDMLHLLLRITDKCYENLLEKITHFDKNDSISIENRQALATLEIFLKDICKLSKPFYKSSRDVEEKIKLRSLNGNERLKIFEKVFENKQRFEDLFVNIDLNFDLENYVWKSFYYLYLSIKSYDERELKINEIEIQKLKYDLKEWLEFYTILAGKETITPYIHAFVFHVPEFLIKFKRLNLYNLQGLEKLNDFSTQFYHQCTNKHKSDNKFLNQMINKQNRIEFFSQCRVK